MNTSLAKRLTAVLIRNLGNLLMPSQNCDRRFVILIYHRIADQIDPFLPSEPDVAGFRWQMEALAGNFNTLGLSEAIQRMHDGTLPPRAVCITFDDGYRSTHDVAMPILKELGLPATVFIASGYLDGSNMWNDRILNAVRTLPGTVLDLQAMQLGAYPLGGSAHRLQTAEQLIAKAKYMSGAERLALANHLEGLNGQRQPEGMMLSPEMVRDLINNNFEIGGHTVTHPILTKLDDTQARQEIVQCKADLESLTGQPVRLFAYPNGKAGMDFDARHVEMARQSGYQAAFITTIGSVSQHTDPFQIPRGRPWDTSPLLFQLRLLRWLAQSP